VSKSISVVSISIHAMQPCHSVVMGIDLGLSNDAGHERDFQGDVPVW
jgi:hypothetical protein